MNPDLVVSFGGRRTLFVMATTHEYTPALRARIVPLITGVGPVEAAAGLASVLGALSAPGHLPQLLVALGSAGSRRLEHARVYQASMVRYRDMDCSAIGFERGVTPFSDDPPALPLGPTIPGIPGATLSSGGAIVNGSAYDAIGADMVDMETFSYAHVARRFGIPLIALRGISDGRDPLQRLEDWSQTLESIGHRLVEALDLLERELESGRLQP